MSATLAKPAYLAYQHRPAASTSMNLFTGLSIVTTILDCRHYYSQKRLRIGSGTIKELDKFVH